jgi:hypothetical protein
MILKHTSYSTIDRICPDTSTLLPVLFRGSRECSLFPLPNKAVVIQLTCICNYCKSSTHILNYENESLKQFNSLFVVDIIYTDTDGSASATSAAALPPQCPASSKRESPLKCVGVREVHEAERPALRRLQQVRVGAGIVGLGLGLGLGLG